MVALANFLSVLPKNPTAHRHGASSCVLSHSSCTASADVWESLIVKEEVFNQLDNEIKSFIL